MTSILLGDIEDPLLPTDHCQIKDISEGPESKITACLCQSDLCNVGEGANTQATENAPSLSSQDFQTKFNEISQDKIAKYPSQPFGFDQSSNLPDQSYPNIVDDSQNLIQQKPQYMLCSLQPKL